MADRVVIVTGAASGIGAAISSRLSGDGWAVAAADVDVMGVEQLAVEAASAGRVVRPYEVDVTSQMGIRSLVDGVIADFGRLDALVNSAGITGVPAATWDLPSGEWERVMAVNLSGTFFACQAVLPHLVESGWGRIVNIASIAGKEGNPNAVPYSASKAGVIGLTKAVAKEVATFGVLVNCVTPAVIETPILQQLTEDHVAYMRSRIPMGRIGKPGEVAAMVAWLVSDECSFTTGAVFDISGGRATY